VSKSGLALFAPLGSDGVRSSKIKLGLGLRSATLVAMCPHSVKSVLVYNVVIFLVHSSI
jgi:hypothetical protein